MNAHVIELVVRGRLSPELIIALEGFLVETDGDGMTRVIGPVVDQARLLGLLDMFDDLHIEVVSMNPVDAGTQPWGTTGIPSREGARLGCDGRGHPPPPSSERRDGLV